MSTLLSESQDRIWTITFNAIEKHNAFDDAFLGQLDTALDQAQAHSDTRVIVLKANGRHFSAGADLAWMQRMAKFSEAENQADALRFAKILHKLYQSQKPTLALVQGAAYGGGIGLIAACDIAFATPSAKFCFSEITLGLLPAVISPYIVKAMGARMATALFLSAEVFDAELAKASQLIHHIVDEDQLLHTGLAHAQRLATFPQQALQEAKTLVRRVDHHPIDDAVLGETAAWIARLRVSPAAQNALHLFLNKSTG